MKISGTDLLAGAIFAISMLALLGPILHLSPTIPAAITLIGLGLYGMDVGWWQGRGSNAIMVWLNRRSPEYQQRVACHEAGHFLAAYLLDLPISSYGVADGINSAEPLTLNTEGNLFIGYNSVDYSAVDSLNTLARNASVNRSPISTDDLLSQKSLLQKLTTVAMAGIVAEELLCTGAAQGGNNDQQQLRHLVRYQTEMLGQNQTNYSLQERWAKLRARDLLRPHQSTLQILAATMQQKADLATCCHVIASSLNPVASQNQSTIEKNLVIKSSK